MSVKRTGASLRSGWWVARTSSRRLTNTHTACSSAAIVAIGVADLDVADHDPRPLQPRCGAYDDRASVRRDRAFERDHEVGWEPLDVSLDLLDQPTGLHAVELCQIFIEHHLAFANEEDSLRDGSSRDELKRNLLIGSIRHFP